MKKLLIGLTLLAFVSANAETIDSEGRKWVTASDIENSANVENVDETLAKQLKDYVILDNDIHYCYFPEIWEADGDTTILDKWEENDDERHKASLYYRIFYRLPYAKLPQSIVKKMDTTSLHDESNVPPLNDFYEVYKRETSIKKESDCAKIGDYIYNDLLKNY